MLPAAASHISCKDSAREAPEKPAGDVGFEGGAPALAYWRAFVSSSYCWWCSSSGCMGAAVDWQVRVTITASKLLQKLIKGVLMHVVDVEALLGEAGGRASDFGLAARGGWRTWWCSS